jgi:carboxynorspermidine decarboxylase
MDLHPIASPAVLPSVPTPCFVVDTSRLQANLDVLREVRERCGARIILALKGFAMFSVFPQIREVLAGTTASSLNEAVLGAETFGGEVHLYAVAYRESEWPALLDRAHHVTFNSLPQWRRFGPSAIAAGVSCGLRINPEYSEVEHDIYNPCRPGTRFGIRAEALAQQDLTGVDGLHFHTMCEQGADVLDRTMARVEARFGPLLPRMKWLNMGGGHHITRKDYDLDRLCRIVSQVCRKYDVDVILEPGEAVALNAGYLVASVLDTFTSGNQRVAVLDTSASAHMPDVLEMPYRPDILGAGRPGERACSVALGGLTCLAGDVIGTYSFDQPPRVGDKLVFTDMAHYTMVKTTMFNGVPHPSIATFDPRGNRLRVVRTFTYEDFRNRLS